MTSQNADSVVPSGPLPSSATAVMFGFYATAAEDWYGRARDTEKIAIALHDEWHLAQGLHPPLVLFPFVHGVLGR